MEAGASDHHHARAVTVVHETRGASSQMQANLGGKQQDQLFLTAYMDPSISIGV